MESSEENNHSTLWMVRAEELFPKTQIVAEDGSLHIPFNECRYHTENSLPMIDINNFTLSVRRKCKILGTS